MSPDKPPSAPPPPPIRRYGPLALISQFLRLEAAAGLVLMASAAAALWLANSSAAPLYDRLLALPIGPHGTSVTPLTAINDGLMTLFFLLVGLEIKRELLTGELATRQRALLPAIAAAGGMLLPVLLFTMLNWTHAATLRGWAIPAATDIAFALGVIALLGRRVPRSLKIFVTAVAILDDLGAILIIALFYTPHVSLPALSLALLCLTALMLFNRAGVRCLAPYLLVGLVLWGAVLASGIHATLAGVAVAFAIPLRGRDDAQGAPPLQRLEYRLHPWVAFAVLPLFGLANAGLSFAGLSAVDLLMPLPLGIAAGLFAGKQLGLMLASWLAVKAGWAQWPAGASAAQFHGVAVLCGIGFTMSLFIGGLAFASAQTDNHVRLGVFTGSLVSALAGLLLLWRAQPRPACSPP